MKIELVRVEARRPPDAEDWYMQVNGVTHGYLYRCDAGKMRVVPEPFFDSKEPVQGYAVGILNAEGEVAHFSVEPTKEAALAFAEKHIAVSQ